MQNALLTSNHNEWETPQELFNLLDLEFNFDLDPCATDDNAKCNCHFTKKDDGLLQHWHKAGRSVFMNPPYGRQIGQWVKKAYKESLKRITVVCLIPARTDTTYWHDYCMKGEIRFLRGRLKFKGFNSFGEYVTKQPATFPSAVVIFRRNGVDGSNQEKKKPDNPTHFFTIKEAAIYANVSRGTLVNWIANGLLPFHALPGRGKGAHKFRRIRRADLDVFLSDCHSESKPELMAETKSKCIRSNTRKGKSVETQLLLLPRSQNKLKGKGLES